MFKSCQAIATIGWLLCACAAPRVAGAQISLGNTGEITSPTEDIYFSSSVTVTTEGETVSISGGTAFQVITSVFYAFWIYVDSDEYYPWESGSTALASAMGNPSVTLDQYGHWAQDGNLSASSGWLSNGSHGAYDQEWLLLNAVYSGGWSGGPGSFWFNDPVSFDIF